MNRRNAVDGDTDEGNDHNNATDPIDTIPFYFLWRRIARTFCEKEDRHIGQQGEKNTCRYIMKFAGNIAFVGGFRCREEGYAESEQPCQLANDGVLFGIAVIGKEEHRYPADDPFHFIAHTGIIVGADGDLDLGGMI